MLSTLFIMFLQFFHIGVFSFGGGYATLPFLYQIADEFDWFSITQLTDMIAVSSITPGPVGVNMATYAGFATYGVLGAIAATTAIILPSFIIVTLVSKILDKFKKNPYVKSVVKSLKAAGCAMLCAVGVKLVFTSDFNALGIIILVIFIISTFFKKRDPLFYLGVSGIIGLILGFFHLT